MKNITKKLLAVQKEIGSLDKSATNPFYSSKYVEINSLLKTVNPVLHAHGLVITQPLSSIDGKPAIVTALIDTESGETIEDTSLVTEMGDAQKQGAAYTYHRRFALISLLGLGAEDQDGNNLKSVAPKKVKAVPAVAAKATRSPSF